MHLLHFLLPFLALVSLVCANSNHGAIAARHHRDIAARTFSSSLESRAQAKKKKCPKRTHKPKASSTAAGKPMATTKTTTNSLAGKGGSSNSAPKPNTSNNNGGNGIINVKSTCGNIGASRLSSTQSGPMGSIDWLNCGIEGGGWRPPFIGVKDLIAVPLRQALQSGSSPFKRCSKFLGLFEKHAGMNNLPPIMLASFALQESSCNPETVGGGGEQGLMQITRDKCGGAPGGNCRDPDFNIGTAARFFAKTLNDNGGNVLVSIGMYNGWRRGMTKKDATAARFTNCCKCQNNLDYLHQFLNGWMQNIDAYSRKMGKYRNLEVCG